MNLYAGVKAKAALQALKRGSYGVCRGVAVIKQCGVAKLPTTSDICEIGGVKAKRRYSQ
jgi:hypothetical protein